MKKGWKKKHWPSYPCLSELSLVVSNESLFQNILIENQRKGVAKSQGIFRVPGLGSGAQLHLGLERQSWEPSGSFSFLCCMVLVLSSPVRLLYPSFSLCRPAFLSSLCAWLPQTGQIYMSLVQATSLHGSSVSKSQTLNSKRRTSNWLKSAYLSSSCCSQSGGRNLFSHVNTVGEALLRDEMRAELTLKLFL